MKNGGHLGFPTRSVFAIFDLQVTLMLPTKFHVNWPFGSGKEAKIDLQERPSWISDQNDLAIFDLQVTPMLSLN